MKMRALFSIAPTILIAALCSCASHENTGPQITTADVHRPADQAIAVARQVITSPPFNLQIVDENRGRLVTNYKEFQGDWHLVRYWPQRSKYIVTVARDLDEPDRRTRIDVATETQQQVAGAMVDGKPKWTTDPDMNPHPERAADLLAAIRNALLSVPSSAPAPSASTPK